MRAARWRNAGCRGANESGRDHNGSVGHGHIMEKRLGLPKGVYSFTKHTFALGSTKVILFVASQVDLVH